MWLIFIHDRFGRSVPADCNVSGHVILQAISLEGRIVVWPNGADITPEWLYEMTENASHAVERTRCGVLAVGRRCLIAQ